MHELLDRIGSAAERIRKLEDNRERLGKFLRASKDSVDMSGADVLENELFKMVAPDPLRIRTVIGVDGGLSMHSYHGMDLILTRAVATVFNYKDGKLGEVGYFPSSIVTPTLIIVADPYTDDEFSMSSSLERQRGEVDLATDAFKKFSPDVVFMDGSIVPHGNDRPAKSSPAWERYQNVIRSFNALYGISKTGLLAGCVEDSRGRRFCEIAAERILGSIDNPRVPELRKILEGTRDTNLLYHVLEKGERTCVFRYSKSPDEHQILADIGGAGKNIYCFYIKSAEFDRPVRVDFYAEKDVAATADRIASLVLSTACHSLYGIPTPIIEADFRAKLQERDADELHDQLVDRIGITPSLMKLRREQRPF